MRRKAIICAMYRLLGVTFLCVCTRYISVAIAQRAQAGLMRIARLDRRTRAMVSRRRPRPSLETEGWSSYLHSTGNDNASNTWTRFILLALFYLVSNDDSKNEGTAWCYRWLGYMKILPGSSSYTLLYIKFVRSISATVSLPNLGDFMNASVERNAWKDARSSFAFVLVDNANAWT